VQEALYGEVLMASLFETEDDVRAIQDVQARGGANVANPRMMQDPINDIRSQVRQNASYSRRSGGNLIGAGIDRSGLLGDSITLNPQMKRATDMRQIQSEAGQRFNPSTPEYFGFVASEMSNRGYHGEAMKAQEYSLAMEQKRATLGKTKADAYAAINPTTKLSLKSVLNTDTGKLEFRSQPEIIASNGVLVPADQAKAGTKITTEDIPKLHESIDTNLMPRVDPKEAARFAIGNYEKDPEGRLKAINDYIENKEKVKLQESKEQLAEKKEDRLSMTPVEKAEESLASAEAELALNPTNKGLLRKVAQRQSYVDKLSDYEDGDPAGRLTEGAVELGAEEFLLTGKMPSVGRGKEAAISRAAILNKAYEIAKGRNQTGKNVSLNRQIVVANMAAARQLEKQKAMVSAFERNAVFNADIALKASETVDRTGVPVFNSWLNAGRKSVLGNKEVAKFHAANETFVNEYAKIMSGSMGNTQVSDALRASTNEILGTKMTVEQYKEVVGLMKMEMKNRMKGFDEEIDVLKAQREESLSAIKGGGKNSSTVGKYQVEEL
jgi:hypothetical protein